jgi:hypothetical protein
VRPSWRRLCAQLFDDFRITFKGGRVQMGRPFYELPAEVRGQILWRIANYDSFDKNGYHDAGVLIIEEGRLLAH